MNVAHVLLLLACAVAHVAAQNFSVTPITCSGSGACGLDQISSGAVRLKVDGACAMGYQEWTQNRSYCEKPCPANYTTAYVTPLSWRKDLVHVVCTASACPDGYTTCPLSNSTGAVCLPPALGGLAGADDLCTAFTASGRGKDTRRVSSCKYPQTPGGCAAGTATCTAPAMTTCPTGYQLTADSMACVRCPPGMNVTAAAPYTCNGTCPGSLVNGTCFGNCARGSSHHGGRCYKDCATGDSSVNATACSGTGGGGERGRRGMLGGKGGMRSEYGKPFTYPPILKTTSPPTDKRGPKVVANCPTGMSFCGGSKCASNIYGVSGCSVFGSAAPTENC